MDDENMREHTFAFWLCLIVSLALFIGGFLVPPTGVVDGSVLTGMGILFGFAVLSQVPHFIKTAEYARITNGDTTIEVRHDHDGDNQ